MVNFEPALGSEQGKTRPCVVIQNNIANELSPTTIVAAITSKFSDKLYPTEVLIEPSDSGLKEKSVVLCNQIRTISIEDRVLKKIGSLKPETINQVNNAIKISLELD